MATGGRLALRPGVFPPTDWFGLFSSVRLDAPSVLPAFMVGGVGLFVLAWLRLSRMAWQGRANLRVAAAVTALWNLPVVVGPPILSLDVFSYVAHGVMLAGGHDPYQNGPAILRDHPAELAADPVWRQSRAPYGPVALGLVKMIVTVTGGEVAPAVVALRLVAVAGTAVIAWSVVAAVPATWKPWTLVVVGASPVVVFQLLGAVHLEAVMMALVALGLLAAKSGRPVASLAALVAAASVKWPAMIAVGVVVVWHAASRGQGSPPWDRPLWDRPLRDRKSVWERLALRGRVVLRERVVLRDLITVVLSMLVCAAAVPNGFGWIGAMATPSSGLTLYAPTTALADVLSWLSNVVGSDVEFTEALRLARGAGLAVAGSVLVWLAATVRSRDLCASVGYGLLVLAVLGPVLYPWYLAWSLVPLAMAADTARRTLLTLTSAIGAFLALPHCELLFVGLPDVAPWIEGNGPMLAAVGCTLLAAAVAISRRVREANAEPVGGGSTPAEGSAG